MILLADLGNTRLKLAVLQPDGHAAPLLPLAHGQADFDAALESTLDGLRPVDAIWLASSAAPALADPLIDRLARRAPLRRAAVSDEFNGLHLAYAEPSRLGVDRFLGLLAARQQGHEAALVVLVGTAMTIDALSPGGRHLGGLILPSPSRMRAALSRDAPHLPADGGALVDFATQTDDALQSGCLLAAASLVERSAERLHQACGSAPSILLAGGGSAALREALAMPAEHHPDLVLQGLAHWGQVIEGASRIA